MNGISIALIVHSLDYYYEPTFALLIRGLNSYHHCITQLGCPRFGSSDVTRGAKSRIEVNSFCDLEYSRDGTRLAIGGSSGFWLYDSATDSRTLVCGYGYAWVQSMR